MSRIIPGFVASDTVSLADENELLRASLAEARARIAALERGAGSDPLTGLATRAGLVEALQRSVGQAERHGTPAALLSIELAAIAAAEPLIDETRLVQLARTLSGLIRSTDLLARTGETELALLLDHLDLDSAIETGERIARCVADTECPGIGPIQVVIATTGILAGDAAEEVLARADRNLARARSGE